MTQCFIVNVQRDHLVHSNRNADRWRRTKLKELVAQQVGWRAKGLNPVPRATIWVGVIKGNRNAYDPSNLTDSMKPVVDQLKRSGIIVDDSHRYVEGPWMLHLGHDRRLRDVVEFVVCIAPWGTDQNSAREVMREYVLP